jgi:AcrR family transcriptional regulator
MTGLRERKKRQTRQQISDVATRLFMEHGFVTVTVAEIADAAEVSVNTVYNYFPTKEDLFFDREEEIVERPAALVRERGPGVSAAEAILQGLRRDVAERSPWIGLGGGWDRFMRVVQDAPTLMSRLMRMQHRMHDRLADTLREETGAGPGDHTPELVAVQLTVLQGIVSRTVGRATTQGMSTDALAELLLEKLNAAEALLSETVLNYGRRPPGPVTGAARAPDAGR